MIGFFWIMIVFFGIIGSIRGWAREWLVLSSAILAFLFIWVVEFYTPFLKTEPVAQQPIQAAVTPTPVGTSPGTGMASSPLEPLLVGVQRQPPLQEQRKFWFRTISLLVLVFFGYQTPRVPVVASKTAKGKGMITDALLGFFIGALNGYLIVGSLWYFVHQIHYPFHSIMAPPDAIQPLAQLTEAYIRFMPPRFLLSVPSLFVAVIVAFVFILVVFI